MGGYSVWLQIDGHGDKWYVTWPDGSKYAGPFKTAAAAKRNLTELKKVEAVLHEHYKQEI